MGVGVRPLGVRKTRMHLGGHQNCQVCRPFDPSKARSRREAGSEIAAQLADPVEPGDLRLEWASAGVPEGSDDVEVLTPEGWIE